MTPHCQTRRTASRAAVFLGATIRPCLWIAGGWGARYNARALGRSVAACRFRVRTHWTLYIASGSVDQISPITAELGSGTGITAIESVTNPVPTSTSKALFADRC